MSVTVTPDPSFSPPRQRIDVTAASGYLYQSAQLYRVLSGVRTLVRSQPSTGGSTATAYDYECPYGQSVSYEIVSQQLITTGGPEWTETWANLSAWTTQSGTPAVNNGNLGFTAAGEISRPLAGSAGGYRLTVANLALGQILAFYAGTDRWTVSVSLVGSNYVLSLANGNQVVNHANVTNGVNANIVVDVIPAGSATTITVTSGSTMFQSSVARVLNLTGVRATGSQGQWGGQVSATAYQTSTVVTVDETSAPTTLNAASGWIVHPLTPALSVPVLTTPDRTAIVLETLGDPVGKSTATVHEILGQSLPIVSTSGPRSSDSFDMVLTSATAVQEAALIGLFRDQTPLLIQILDPAVGFPTGFYSVGDVTRARAIANGSSPRRSFTLPLRAAQPPQGSVANPGWSWAGLAAAYTSWNAVRAAYATWSGVAANVVGS